MVHPLISEQDVETYQRDGVVIVRGLFADQVDVLREVRSVSTICRSSGLSDGSM